MTATIDKTICITGIGMILNGIIGVLLNSNAWLEGVGFAFLLSGAFNILYYRNSTKTAFIRLIVMNMMMCFVGLLSAVDNPGHFPSILLVVCSGFIIFCLFLKKKLNSQL